MLTIIAISTLISFIFAPLGCLVLWKKYVYYSDGLAHASMFAAAISIIAGVPVFYAGIVNTLIFAFIVFKLKNNSGNNAAIGMASSVMVSAALVLTYIFPGRFNLAGLLFGDIITANFEDMVVISLILCFVCLFFFLAYKRLLLMILNRDIARSRGIRVEFWEFGFLTLLSFAVLASIKIVGALLVTSMMLIPAMSSRLFARSPAKMIFGALIVAQLMNASGIMLSLHADMPFAPIIIISGAVIYIICALLVTFFRKN